MAKVSAHGKIVFQFLASNGQLIAYCEDKTTLFRSPYTSGWKIRGKIKPDRTVEQATDNIRTAMRNKNETWRLNVKRMPSLRTLEEWASEGVCETVTGDTVEPDGIGRDGAPSWLRALCMI
jgi:hypothetical protein